MILMLTALLACGSTPKQEPLKTEPVVEKSEVVDEASPVHDPKKVAEALKLSADARVVTVGAEPYRIVHTNKGAPPANTHTHCYITAYSRHMAATIRIHRHFCHEQSAFDGVRPRGPRASGALAKVTNATVAFVRGRLLPSCLFRRRMSTALTSPQWSKKALRSAA